MAQKAVSVSVHALERPQQVLLEHLTRLRTTGDGLRQSRSENLGCLATSEFDVRAHGCALDERAIGEVSNNQDAGVEARGGDSRPEQRQQELLGEVRGRAGGEQNNLIGLDARARSSGCTYR